MVRTARSASRALSLLALVLGTAAVDVQVDPAGEWAAQVETASAGTTVVFAPGRYEGCSSGGLALASGVALAGSSGAAATVIDCMGAGRHFAVGGGANVTIEGLTLTGGVASDEGSNSSDGGCVLVESPGGSRVVADSVFSNCSAASRGGAIAVRGSAALNISRSNFTDNDAGEDGGAIHAAASNVSASGTRFERNSAKTRGGAVAVTERTVLDLNDTHFDSNRVLVAEHYETWQDFEAVEAGGGAIFARDGCSILVSGLSEFIDNTAQRENRPNADEGTGGGVSMWGGSTLRVQGPVMFARNAARYGGAVFSSDRGVVSDRGRQGRRSERGFCFRVAHAACSVGREPTRRI